MFARLRVEFTNPAVGKCANVLVLYSGLCNLCTLTTETQNFKNCNKALFRFLSYIKYKNKNYVESPSEISPLKKNGVGVIRRYSQTEWLNKR
jgi:hypothetical protein